MSLLSRLFGSDGCANHHLTDYKSVGQWKIQFRKGWHRDAGYVVKVKNRRECQHQGCDYDESTWKTVSNEDGQITFSSEREARLVLTEEVKP